MSHEVGPTTNNPNGFTVRQEHRLVITEDTASEFYCPEAVAGKTGYLLKAGNTLVTYGEKDGRRLVSVILKGSPRQYFLGRPRPFYSSASTAFRMWGSQKTRPGM